MKKQKTEDHTEKTKQKKQCKVEKTQRIRRKETEIGEIAHTSSNRSGLRKKGEIILEKLDRK